MSHIFICYSHKNRTFAKRIETGLQASGYCVWRDESHGVTHHDWQADVLAALDNTSVMLVILSPDSVASEPVDFEVKAAQERGIPIVAVQYVASDPHPRLAGTTVIDFTQIAHATGCELEYAFTFVKLLLMIDQVQPVIHYLRQILKVDPQVRRMATTSAEDYGIHSLQLPPQSHQLDSARKIPGI